MNQMFLYKVQHVLEAIFMLLVISWQPLFGCVASGFAIWYYSAMIKTNVVDKKYEGSWKKYFKATIKNIFIKNETEP